MANTRSAAKQARASERRRVHNKSIKSRLHTLETRYLEVVKAGEAEAAGQALRSISSALDKAAKTKVIHVRTASRKKSRLAAHLKTLQATAA